MSQPDVVKKSWPFTEWLDLAVRHYGLSPSEFWQMSVKDWLSLLDYGLNKAGAARPLQSHDLQNLMQAYPDQKDIE